jgi:hypothetical protein
LHAHRNPAPTVLLEHPQRDRVAARIPQSTEGHAEQLASDAPAPVGRIDVDGPDLARGRADVAIGAGDDEADEDAVD